MASPWYVCGTGYERASYSVHCHHMLHNLCFVEIDKLLHIIAPIPCVLSFSSMQASMPFYLLKRNKFLRCFPSSVLRVVRDLSTLMLLSKYSPCIVLRFVLVGLGCLTMLFFPSRYVVQRSVDCGRRSPRVGCT